MPYPTDKSLPNNIKKKSKKIRDIWRVAFNNAYKKYNGDESKAFIIANGVIKKYKESHSADVSKARRLQKHVLKNYSGENMSIEHLQLDGETPAKTGKVITSVEKLEEVVPVEVKDELQEQLTVIKEVRGELAKAYSDIKGTNTLNEQLKKDIVVLQDQLKGMEKLQKELDIYNLKEVEAEKLAYTERLAKLSQSFKYLGQVKTVEELSKLDKKTVDELEKVTQLAITTKASEKLDSVTMPSQATQVQPKVEKIKQVETLKNTNFAESICDVLTGQQEKSGKRIISL